MNKEKEKLFIDLYNTIYESLSHKQIHSIKELRNPNLILTLLKEM